MNIRSARPRPPVLAGFVLASLLVLTGCGAPDAGSAAEGDGPAGVSTSPSPSTTSTDSPAETAPRLIQYAGGEHAGIEIHDRADAEELSGAPDAFKQFIGRTAQRIADASTCADGYVGVTVAKLRTDGFAAGGVNDCGGYAALWAVVDGSWQEIVGSQELWDCAVLERYGVPSDVAGAHCYDYDAQEERSYQAS